MLLMGITARFLLMDKQVVEKLIQCLDRIFMIRNKKVLFQDRLNKFFNILIKQTKRKISWFHVL